MSDEIQIEEFLESIWMAEEDHGKVKRIYLEDKFGSTLSEKFLGITPTFLGRLPRNKKLSSLIREERAVLAERGLSDFTYRMNYIAQQISGQSIGREESFFGRFISSISGESR